MKTLKDLIEDLSLIGRVYSSAQIPVTVDGKEIEFVEVETSKNNDVKIVISTKK